MENKHFPQIGNGSDSPLTVSTDSDFATALLGIPTPLCVEESLQSIYDALPTEVQKNISAVQAGWQFTPETGKTSSFVTLQGKDSNGVL